MWLTPLCPYGGLSVRIPRLHFQCYFDPSGLPPISPAIIYCFHQTPSLIYFSLCFSNEENVFYISHTLHINNKILFQCGALMFTSDLLWQYSVFAAHMLCSCWCCVVKPCKSLWCWCWKWNYGKNVQWCVWAECTWLFVLVVVWGCLIVALWFWKNTELLDWWNIPKIQQLRALNSLHMSSVSTV